MLHYCVMETNHEMHFKGRSSHQPCQDKDNKQLRCHESDDEAVGDFCRGIVSPVMGRDARFQDANDWL